MEKKQSSVEWLISELIYKSEFQDLPNDYYLMSDKDIDKIIEQAKAMHKEEYIDAWMNGQNDSGYSQKELRQMAQEDYNETFGNETE